MWSRSRAVLAGRVPLASGFACHLGQGARGGNPGAAITLIG
ncbi:hypothetical protein [Sphingomonas faeni]